MAERFSPCWSLQPAHRPALYVVRRAFTENIFQTWFMLCSPSTFPRADHRRPLKRWVCPAILCPLSCQDYSPRCFEFFFFHKAPARGKRERSQKWEWRSGRRVQPGRVPEIWSESHTGGKVDPTGFFDYDNLTDAGTSRNANDDWKLSRVNKTVFKQWQLTEKTLTST